ncbi:MAG: hypothetical protein WCK71_02405 [bacterium]
MQKKPTKTRRKGKRYPVDSTNEFIGRYTGYTDDELVNINHRVRTGSGWVSAKARCLGALAEEFYARSIEWRIEEQP